MTDTQFYKSFTFNIFKFNKHRMTDCNKGSRHHYFARLIKGKARIVSAENTVLLDPGDVFYIPKDLVYKSYWYPDEKGELAFSSFGFSFLPTDRKYKLQILENIDVKPIETLENTAEVTPLTISLLYSFFAKNQHKMETKPVSSGEMIVQNAVEILNSQPYTSVPKLATLCNVSESGLYKLFKQHLSKTPVDVKHQVLAQKATDLLITTDLPVEEISRTLGFSSSSYFRKTLFEQTGKTPLEIRKKSKTV